MAQRPKRGLKADIKAPLILAAILAIIAFVGVFVFATGGTNNQPEIKLALSAAGGVFVVTLVVCATLIMVERPNDEELGQGTGINRRSADLYAAAKARKEERERREREQAGSGTGDAAAGARERDDAATKESPEDDGPTWGQRAHPETHN
ncbi:MULTISPECIES: hypothetical protein [Rothia]|uniref:Uncharacterized protein n=1 Tax=Rothia kristinae TaxID=37923 RepID=A0A7T3FAG0_9MICC|nr:hypothetical protein [Rothia kristinae]TDP51872.1 hypothetical protein DEU33_1996 [Kocuria sp. AG109]KTR40274.1 hypothetical protein RSA5_00835 [Rothia kristinae]KTR55226.1 hypothetical protein SA11R_08060 [Rothia kristinae]KTR67139.1 hypothetical protein SA15R_09545 [Rothia kristinae]KTR69380.1 hypothetical protein SA12R_03645 [Rothia kristinae]